MTMEQDTSPSGISSNGHNHTPHPKRTRILLSCAPCRNSKLKCDRDQPCGQCQKKGRADLCVYAPKPDRHKPARGMAARLKRLEGMVRGMMDVDGNVVGGSDGGAGGVPARETAGVSEEPVVTGQVVRHDGETATTYVGATHVLAMLEDIEDLKSYFEEPEEADDATSPEQDLEGPDILVHSRGAPRNREDLIGMLPERQVLDRLITRYFSTASPSQHIIHRPTFMKQYAQFWKDPNSAHLHWIAQLYMMLALAIWFSNFSAPHEVKADSPLSAHERVMNFKSCAGWALLWGKYNQPTFATLPAFLLYVESHFQFNRATQMTCYVLSGVLIRLMLKMGLHRDPSKLANITPFEGEMRRRLWNMAIQLDLLVAFHMGLPSMLQGIETDTQIPRNLEDNDFGEDSMELPPSRPDTDYTYMTYANNKTKILRIFAQLARQAHALTPPSYAEVMQLDTQLQETWDAVPDFIKPRPLAECVGDPPSLITQRYGLASLHQKSLCVLHRRYLAEAIPKSEHEYSRKRCLQAAMTLMDYQYTIWDACQPGHVLSQNGWFVSSLAVHDFTLAAMVIYLAIQTESPADSARGGLDWPRTDPTTPTKAELRDMLKRSHSIWDDLAEKTPEFRKTADTLAIMLSKVGVPVATVTPGLPAAGMTVQTSASSNDYSIGSSVVPKSSVDTTWGEDDPLATLGLEGLGSGSGQTAFSFGQGIDATPSMSFPGVQSTSQFLSNGIDFDPAWMSSGDNMDWRYLDISMSAHFDAGTDPSLAHAFLERTPQSDMDALDGDGGVWNQPFGRNLSGRY